MQKSESIAALATALAAFQGELEAAPKESDNPFYRSRYADLATVWETCRRALSKNGLAVSQLPTIDTDRIVLDTILMHKSGEWLASSLLLTPMRERKDVGWVPSMDPQAVGSAITYGRRYALCAMLGVVADDDDDANEASGVGAEAPASTARMPQSMATAPKGLCPIHHVPFVHRSGIGAKGKYDFWACPSKVGAGYCKEKPTEGAPANPTNPTATSGTGVVSPAPAAPSPSPDTHTQPEGAPSTPDDITQAEFATRWTSAGLPAFRGETMGTAWALFQQATGFRDLAVALQAGWRRDALLLKCIEYKGAQP